MYESPYKVSIVDEIAKEAAARFDNAVWRVTENLNIGVDKDELVKALAYDRGQYDKGYGDGYNDGKRDAWQWISVEERLPEESANYLTYGVFLPLGVKAMDLCRFNGKGWMIDQNVKITHWMPLPEPPKEDDDD